MYDRLMLNAYALHYVAKVQHIHPGGKSRLLSAKAKLHSACAYSLPALPTGVVPIEPPRCLDRLIYRLPRLPGHAPDTRQQVIISIVVRVTWHAHQEAHWHNCRIVE